MTDNEDGDNPVVDIVLDAIEATIAAAPAAERTALAKSLPRT
jgi:hypothetical protein